MFLSIKTWELLDIRCRGISFSVCDMFLGVLPFATNLMLKRGKREIHTILILSYIFLQNEYFDDDEDDFNTDDGGDDGMRSTTSLLDFY